MTCTVAAIVWFLGYMPPRGTVITVPRSKVAPYSEQQRRKGEACARKYGIQWKIAEDQ